MSYAAYIVLGICAINLVIVAVAVMAAPQGFEDDRGFHLGRSDKA